MLRATITAVHPATPSRSGRAFARSQTLASADNPEGLLTVPLHPPYWTAGRPPRPGMAILVGSVEEGPSEASNSDWRARDTCPAFDIEHYSPSRLQEPTLVIRSNVARRPWQQLLHCLGLLPAVVVEKRIELPQPSGVAGADA